jgi:hypothetical protein
LLSSHLICTLSATPLWHKPPPPQVTSSQGVPRFPCLYDLQTSQTLKGDGNKLRGDVDGPQSCTSDLFSFLPSRPQRRRPATVSEHPSSWRECPRAWHLVCSRLPCPLQRANWSVFAIERNICPEFRVCREAQFGSQYTPPPILHLQPVLRLLPPTPLASLLLFPPLCCCIYVEDLVILPVSHPLYRKL